ncbi:hypothetical protein ACHWQZ_G010637 [Mnemiopsis leidyi]
MMKLSSLIYVALVFSTSSSASVLVIAGHRGSHLFVSLNVADKLAEFGYDVTVLTIYSDNRIDLKDKAFRFISVADDAVTQEIFERMEKHFTDFMYFPSTDMWAEFFIAQVRSSAMSSVADDYSRLGIDYFNGEEFAKLVEREKFDLVVLEDYNALLAKAALKEMNIPVMGVVCHTGAAEMNSRYSLPGLLNSVPGLTNDVTDSPPSFYERWQTLVRTGRFYLAISTIIESFIKKTPKPEDSLKEYLIAMYDVVFINDHPAFSFPFLTPPNTFYLGHFNLENYSINPLPEEYQKFLANCPYQHKILFSFGSYLEDPRQFTGMSAIIKTLSQMNICVIMKSNLQLELPSGKFLQKSWIPQKDLLGSGKLDLFFSHCGNNGRMEAIFFNVPLLCVPLFGDQYYNARLVRRNGFGSYLTWEELTEESLTETIKNLLGKKEEFVEKMRRAADIARNDPGAGTETLRYYTDLLVKNGNADHLVNRIIMNQSTNEIYNLDIAVLALVCVLLSIVFILFVLVKCLRLLCCRLFTKIKAD